MSPLHAGTAFLVTTALCFIGVYLDAPDWLTKVLQVAQVITGVAWLLSILWGMS